MYKVSTFAPALLERQSLMIDILLKSKWFRKEKRKKLPKSLAVKIKPLTFAPAFENEAQVL